MAAPLACYALTPRGAALARRLGAVFEAACFLPQRLARQGEQGFQRLPALLEETFHRYRGHIFITAPGIAVRCIAPHLGGRRDPAVVVCDEDGHFVVSLLSEHRGGNALARRLADHLGGTAVAGAASDAGGLPAPDLLAQQAGCVILDWDRVRDINAALLAGETVQLYDPFGVLSLEDDGLFTLVEPPRVDPGLPALSVHWRRVEAAPRLLRLAVPALHVGLDCRRGSSGAEILEAVRVILAEAGLEPRALASLAAATARRDEAGLAEAAAVLHVPLRFFSPDELAAAPAPSPSAMAARFFGVERVSVCEGAALLAAGGEDALLLVPRTDLPDRIAAAVALPEALADAL